MDYKNDDREVYMTMSRLAEILEENFGEINNRGCYTDNGAWLSLESVLNAISEEI